MELLPGVFHLRKSCHGYILEAAFHYRCSILFDGRHFVTGCGGYASVALVMLLSFEFEKAH